MFNNLFSNLTNELENTQLKPIQVEMSNEALQRIAFYVVLTAILVMVSKRIILSKAK